MNQVVASPQMEQVQKSFPIATNAAPKALVIGCSDPKIQFAIRCFLINRLNIPREEWGTEMEEQNYVRLTVAGGIASLTEQEVFKEEFGFMWRHSKLFVAKMPSIELVIQLSHEPCKKYLDMHERMGDSFLMGYGDMRTRQISDLRRVETILPKYVPRTVAIESYFGRLVAEGDQARMVFDRI